LVAPDTIDHVERLKQSIRDFQRAQSEEIRTLREQKANQEWQTFKEEQRVQTEALEASLAAKLAKKEEKAEGQITTSSGPQPPEPVGTSESTMEIRTSSLSFNESEQSSAPMESERKESTQVAVGSSQIPLAASSSAPTPTPDASLSATTTIASYSIASLVTSQPQIPDDEEKALIIGHRLKMSQLRLEALSRKEKSTKIESVFDVLSHLTEEEVNEALLLFGDDEFDVIEEFDRYPEVRELRRKIAQKRTEEEKKNKKKVKRTASGASGGSAKKINATLPNPGSAKAKKSGQSSEKASSSSSANKASGSASTPRPAGGNLEFSTAKLTTSERHSKGTSSSILAPSSSSIDSTGAPSSGNEMQVDDAQLDPIAALLPHGTDLNYERPASPKITSLNSSRRDDEDPDGGDDEDDDSNEETFELDGEDYATRTHKKKKQITVKKLKLDDAIAQGSMEGWSSARIRAWNVRHENPNAYYYRFNHPGEVQRNGKWTQAERERFFARMTEVGVNGQWGIFAKEIYGRVGYQCANFYRQMIENNEIEDPRYVVDESGKAHFLFSKRKKGTTKKALSANSMDADDLEDDEEGGGSANASDLAAGMTRIVRDGREILIPKINVPIRRPSAAVADTETETRRASVTKRSAPKSSTIAQSTQEEPNAEESSTSGMDVSTEASTEQQTASTSKRSTAKASSAQEPRVKKKPTKKRKREGAGGGDSDDAEYRPASNWTREKVDREAVQALKSRLDANPLPGFKDVITNVEIIQPAISPYGHVLSYSTWLKCLASDPKNTCPFTKKPLKKRDLVNLTWDNIASFQDKIDRSGQP
jgi:hypothetical protein